MHVFTEISSRKQRYSTTVTLAKRMSRNMRASRELWSNLVHPETTNQLPRLPTFFAAPFVIPGHNRITSKTTTLVPDEQGLFFLQKWLIRITNCLETRREFAWLIKSLLIKRVAQVEKTGCFPMKIVNIRDVSIYFRWRNILLLIRSENILTNNNFKIVHSVRSNSPLMNCLLYYFQTSEQFLSE